MRASVSADSPPQPQRLQPSSSGSGSGTPLPHVFPRAGPGSPFAERYGEDHQSAWAKQEQQVRARMIGYVTFGASQASFSFFFLQMMMREQDHTMDSIAGTLSTIAQQANLMGQEIAEHNEYVSTLRFRPPDLPGFLRIINFAVGCSRTLNQMWTGQKTDSAMPCFG
jgi:hypothetical protein